MAAIISSLAPGTAKPGDTVVVSGSGFAAGAVISYAAPDGRSIDVAATVLSAVEISSVVPDVLEGLAGVLGVTVTNLGESPSNSADLGIEESPGAEPVRSLCSLGALKEFLGLGVESAGDAQLKVLIAVASAQIAGFCGRSFFPVSVTDELHDGDGTNLLRPRQTPVVAVSAIAIDGQAVDASELQVYPEWLKFADRAWNPRLRSSDRVFPAGTQNIRISYTAGYSAVPAEISHACMMQVVFLRNIAAKQGIVSETNQVAQATTSYAQSQLAPAVRVICHRFRRLAIAGV